MPLFRLVFDLLVIFLTKKDLIYVLWLYLLRFYSFLLLFHIFSIWFRN